MPKRKHFNPIKELEKIMSDIQKWLQDTLADIVKIAHGNPTDQQTKDKVEALIAQTNALADKVAQNDSTDSTQEETLEALKTAMTAVIKQLGDVPPPVPPVTPPEE